MDLDADGGGAKYWVSELIEWKIQRGATSRERLVEGSDPALIAGILSSWVSMLYPVVSSKKEANITVIRFQKALQSSMMTNGFSGSLEEEEFDDTHFARN